MNWAWAENDEPVVHGGAPRSDGGLRPIGDLGFPAEPPPAVRLGRGSCTTKHTTNNNNRGSGICFHAQVLIAFWWMNPLSSRTKPTNKCLLDLTITLYSPSPLMNSHESSSVNHEGITHRPKSCGVYQLLLLAADLRRRRAQEGAGKKNMNKTPNFTHFFRSSHFIGRSNPAQ